MTKLQNIRRQRGYSQSELSRLSGVPIKTIQGYESTKDINRAAALTVHKLAQALGVESRNLLEI